MPKHWSLSHRKCERHAHSSFHLLRLSFGKSRNVAYNSAGIFSPSVCRFWVNRSPRSVRSFACRSWQPVQTFAYSLSRRRKWPFSGFCDASPSNMCVGLSSVRGKCNAPSFGPPKLLLMISVLCVRSPSFFCPAYFFERVVLLLQWFVKRPKYFTCTHENTGAHAFTFTLHAIRSECCGRWNAYPSCLAFLSLVSVFRHLTLTASRAPLCTRTHTPYRSERTAAQWHGIFLHNFEPIKYSDKVSVGVSVHCV